MKPLKKMRRATERGEKTERIEDKSDLGKAELENIVN